MTGTFTIVCISREEGFAKAVYQYLYAQLEREQQLAEGKKQIYITREKVRLTENNEIQIDKATKVPDGMVKWILELYLKSDTTKFRDYGVIQFEDSFIISKIIPLNELGIYTCDLCNYSTLYQEQLYGHRMMHYFGMS